MLLKKILTIVLFMFPLCALADTCPTQALDWTTGTWKSFSIIFPNATACYYFANSGSDSTGTGTKANPLAHGPYMATCTANCSTIPKGAGILYIGRGGDTWGNADLGIDFQQAGNSTAVTGYTVDPTWFNASTCGSTFPVQNVSTGWCRPIFDCGGTSFCANTAPFIGNAHSYFKGDAAYVVIDNYEMANQYLDNETGVNVNYVFMTRGNDQATNLYIHKWQRVSAYMTASAWSFDGTNNVVTFTVDSTRGVTVGQTLNISGFVTGSFLNCANGCLTVCNHTTTGCSDPTSTTLTATGKTHATASATESGSVQINNTGDIVGIVTYIGGGGLQTTAGGNIIDGSDSTLNDGTGIQNAAIAANNYIQYVYNGINGGFDDIHGNVVAHVDFYATSGSHTNGIYGKGPMNASGAANPVIVIHDNIIRDSNSNGTSNGAVVWYVTSANCPTCTTLWWNSLVYNWPGIDPPMVTVAGDSGLNGGTFYYWNSLIQTDASGGCIGNTLSGYTAGTAYAANIFCINSTGTGSVFSNPNSVFTAHDEGGELLKTLAQANSAGYCEPNGSTCTTTYPYQPTSGSAPTVGAGLTLAQLQAFLPATYPLSPYNDTSLAVSYDSVHKIIVVPGRTSVAQPSIGNWDVGPYRWVNPFGTLMSPNTLTTSGTAVH